MEERNKFPMDELILQLNREYKSHNIANSPYWRSHTLHDTNGLEKVNAE